MRLDATWFSAVGAEIPDLWPLHTVLNHSTQGTQLPTTEAALSLLAQTVLMCLGAVNIIPTTTKALSFPIIKIFNLSWCTHLLIPPVWDQSPHFQGATLPAAFPVAVLYRPDWEEPSDCPAWAGTREPLSNPCPLIFPLTTKPHTAKYCTVEDKEVYEHSWWALHKFRNN